MTEGQLFFKKLNLIYQFIKGHLKDGKYSLAEVYNEIGESDLNRQNVVDLINYDFIKKHPREKTIRSGKIIFDHFNKTYGRNYRVKRTGTHLEVLKSRYYDLRPEIPVSLDKIPSETFNFVNRGSSVRIIDTWIPTFASKDQRAIMSWLNSNPSSFKILILHPFSPLVDKRCKSLSSSISSPISLSEARKDILNIIENIFDVKGTFRHIDIDIRLYDETNGLNLFILGDKIFYSPYIKNNFTTNTYAYLINKEEHPFRYRELEDHFEKIWESALQINTKQFRNLQSRHRKEIEAQRALEKQLKNLSRRYFLFNLDEKSAKYPYQMSTIDIDEDEKGKAILTYSDRNSADKLISVEGWVQLSGKLNIAFRFTEGDFYLKLVARRFSRKSDARFIEGVYLHYDKNETSRSSIGIMIESEELIQRYSNLPEGERPLASRLTANIPIEIQWYLRQERGNILETNNTITRWSSFNKNEVALFQSLKKYIEEDSEWYIHYPERHPHDMVLKANPLLNTIGFGEITILKPLQGLSYQAKFLSSEGIDLSGTIEMIKTQKGEYIVGSFFSDRIYLAINFRFFKGRSALWGAYSIIYSNGHQGSGLLIATKKNAKEYPHKSLNPIKEEDIEWVKGLGILSHFNVPSQDTYLFKNSLMKEWANWEGKYTLEFLKPIKSRYTVEIFSNGYIFGFRVHLPGNEIKKEKEDNFKGVFNKTSTTFSFDLYFSIGEEKNDLKANVGSRFEKGLVSCSLSSEQGEGWEGVFAGTWKGRLVHCDVLMTKSGKY